MSVTNVNKTYSAANAITTGTALVMFGPIFISHLDDWTMYFKSTAAVPINFRLQGSIDKAREFAADIPLGQLTNDNFGVLANAVNINSIIGNNSYGYLTVLASATATIATDTVALKIQGKVRK